MKIPALLGGPRAFECEVPISQPTLPHPRAVVPDMERALESKQLTNGSYVRRFEREVECRLGVSYAIATSSCTSGLLLVLRALGVKGEVILPSFTFFATAHAVIWNGLKPVFADCDPGTLNVDPASVEARLTRKTEAIIGVHIFGNPCPIRELEQIAGRNHLHLLFDAAHGLGASYRGAPIGRFGDAEVFSLSPTKTVVAGEGGIITTRSARLAEALRAARDYGNSGDYDPVIVGLNARMEEFNAILGSVTLKALDENIAFRTALAAQYARGLAGIAGLSLQAIPSDNRSSFKDFGVLVDEEFFGLSRDELHETLRAEGIMTKKYFSPPVHRQKAYIQHAPKDPLALVATEYVSSMVLCLPMFAHMEPSTVSRICEAIRGIQEHAVEIRRISRKPEALFPRVGTTVSGAAKNERPPALLPDVGTTLRIAPGGVENEDECRVCTLSDARTE